MMTRAVVALLLRVEAEAAPEVRADAAERGELLLVLGVEPYGPQGACFDPGIVLGFHEVHFDRDVTLRVATSSATLIHFLGEALRSAGAKKAASAGLATIAADTAAPSPLTHLRKRRRRMV